MALGAGPANTSAVNEDVPSPSDNSNDEECKVCGFSPASYHFGATSCRPCAAFFRRSVVQRRKYHCNYEDNCLLHYSQRPMCAYCRYKKTLEVGMNVNNIRLNFDKNGPMEQKLPRLRAQRTVPPGPKYMSDFVEGYREFLSRTKELYFVLNPAIRVNGTVEYKPATLPEFFVNDRSQLHSMFKMLEWHYSPFKEFHIEDQSAIFERFQPYFTRFNMFYLSVLNFPDVPKRLVLFYGGYIDESEKEYLYIHDNDPDLSLRQFTPLLRKLFTINEKMRNLRIDEMEVGALGGLVLWREVNYHFNTTKYNERIEKIIEELTAYCKSKTENYKARLGQLLCSLRDMEELMVLVKGAVVVGKILNDYPQMHQVNLKMARLST